MRDTNLVNALRCVSTPGGPIGDCKKCPFCKTESVPEDLAGKVNLTEWSSCDVDVVGLAAADRIEAQAKEIENLRAQLRHLCRNWDLDRLEKLAEADKDGRLVVLPFTSGRTLLCKENIDSLRLMKDVEPAIRYCSSCGIVFHMGYNVFCDLVEHGRITAVSEETEKALEGKRNA